MAFKMPLCHSCHQSKARRGKNNNITSYSIIVANTILGWANLYLDVKLFRRYSIQKSKVIQTKVCFFFFLQENDPVSLSIHF